MSVTSDPAYFEREQSLIKHRVLEKYLERFARIVGKGFEGPALSEDGGRAVEAAVRADGVCLRWGEMGKET